MNQEEYVPLLRNALEIRQGFLFFLQNIQPAQPFPRAGAGAQRGLGGQQGGPGASLAVTGREAGASGLGWDRTRAGRTPEARFPACGF